MLAFVPIFTDEAALQVISTSAILTCSIAIQCMLWYWRGDTVSYIEASVFFSLIICVTCGALFVEHCA